MKYTCLLIVTALLFCSSISAQSQFVKVKDHQFSLSNKAYYYIGANYWYGGLLALAKDPKKGKERLRKELDFLHAKGVNNLRVMGGVEGSGKIIGENRAWPTLQITQGNFNDSILTGLDYLLAEMGKRNMKAVIFLSNNWNWSGGFLQYLNWNGLLPDSIMQRKLTWDENRDFVKQFYSCGPCKEAYNNQVKYIVNRVNTITHKAYKNDPAIMSWELANEPRPMRPVAIPEFTKWIADAAGLIKTLDKNHLVTTGSEGQMGNETLETFEAIHAGKNIDYLTIHIWPKNWGWFSDTAISKSFTNLVNNTHSYISQHVAIAKHLQKPLVIEEFGLPRDTQSFKINSATKLRDNYYQTIFALCNQSRISKGIIGGCNFWGFGGMGRASATGNYWWAIGDDYTNDPPPEEQGLNSVFDTDTSTWKVVVNFTKMIK